MNRRTIIAIFSLLISLCALGGARAAETFIEKDTEWSGTVNITAMTVIRTGVCLTVKPGTSVFFAEGTGLLVSGSVVAEGAAQNQITLAAAPAKGSDSPRSWEGILFADASAISKFAFVRISGASTINATNSKATFLETAVEKSARGFNCANGGSMEFMRCRFYDFAENALTAGTGGKFVIVESSIERCAKAAIEVGQRSGVKAMKTSISDCETGIALIGEDSVVESCTIKRCRGGIIVNQGGGNTVLIFNTISETEMGIYCLRFASPRIYANSITKSDVALKCFQKSNPEVENNRIEGNKTGIMCIQLCTPRIFKNTITGNGTGIYLQLSSYAAINSNNFGSNKTDIELDTMSADWEKRAGQKPVRSEQARNEEMVHRGKALPERHEDDLSGMGAVNARGNWWGEVVTAELKKAGAEGNISSIKDYFDAPRKSYEGWEGEYIQDKVDYSGFLSAPVPDADVGGFKAEEKK